ncbi:gag-polyprotein putative aspartyl protease domain-containing protein [Ditylenchus destructor]|uniref:Gag-polyprotein putative aspartyl protease domain-containing protein n=1 Tax=Ditylenchus destructor TaxID=166010 RepID=A0AAD4QWJ6_9BILA|nr:gag-polyprotein putative aspartyl protease domain-containing protein [Ditylenchus destructor]
MINLVITVLVIFLILTGLSIISPYLGLIKSVLGTALAPLQNSLSQSASWAQKKSRDFRRQKEPVTAAVSFSLRPPENRPLIHSFVPPSFSIGTVNAISQPYITVSVYGQQIPALLDSGSAISYCQHSTLRKLNILDRLEPPHARVAHAAYGTDIHFQGQAKLPISIGGVTVRIPVLVSEDRFCPAKLLLGVDYVRAVNELGHSVGFNFATNLITIGSQELPILCNLIFIETSPVYKIYAPEQIILEPRTDTFLYGKLNQPVENSEVFVYQNPNSNLDNVIVGRTVSKIENNELIPLRLLNLTTSKAKIFAGTILALVEKVNPESCKQVYALNSENPTQNLARDEASPEANRGKYLPKYADGQSLVEKLNLENTCLTPEGKNQLKSDAIPQGHKFSRPWVGPYRVIGVKRPNVTVKTMGTEKEKLLTVHMDKVKHFINDSTLPLRGEERSFQEYHEKVPEPIPEIRESIPELPTEEIIAPSEQPLLRRSTRQRKPNPRYADYITH